MSVDRWLRERTYGPQAFDRDVLRDVKRADGRRVSVVLPTLQVEQTVGPIVGAIAEAWMDGDAPLVDELVVIDGASTDGTGDEAARAAGARVVQEHDVLPQVPGRGKGAAMWRSLAVTTGEVMAFLDADVVDRSESRHSSSDRCSPTSPPHTSRGSSTAARGHHDRWRTRQRDLRAPAHQPVPPGARRVHAAVVGRGRRTT